MNPARIALTLLAGLGFLATEAAAQTKKATAKSAKPVPAAKASAPSAKAPAKQDYSETRGLTITKLVDWAPGEERMVHVAGGTAQVKTLQATFRFAYRKVAPIDIPFVAFKHEARVWVGPVFPHYALAGDMFFGIDNPEKGTDGLQIGGNQMHMNARPEQSLEELCGKFDEKDYIPPYLKLYQSISLRHLFGSEYHGQTSGPVPGSTLEKISTDGSELTLKFSNPDPKATAELVLGGPTTALGILRAYVNGKGVPIAHAYVEN